MSKRSRMMRKENNELENRLDGRFDDVLTDIVVYIRGANISELEQESVRRDITQMLIDAQSRGETADDVIGGDYKAFCDAIIAEIPKLNAKQRIMTAIRDILPAMCVLTVIWAAFAIIKQIVNGRTWYIAPLSVSDAAIGIALLLIATLTVVYITKCSFNAKPMMLLCLILLILAAALCGSLLLPDKTIFSPSLAAVAALIILMLAAYKIIDDKL